MQFRGERRENYEENMRSVRKGNRTEEWDEKKEKIDKESRRAVYLSALCHSSSGHLLYYIKGFALISMPLHPSHGVCLCVHPYSTCVCVPSYARVSVMY